MFIQSSSGLVRCLVYFHLAAVHLLRSSRLSIWIGSHRFFFKRLIIQLMDRDGSLLRVMSDRCSLFVISMVCLDHRRFPGYFLFRPLISYWIFVYSDHSCVAVSHGSGCSPIRVLVHLCSFVLIIGALDAGSSSCKVLDRLWISMLASLVSSILFRS